jgi:hypothetical protein
MADGHVETLTRDISESELRAAISRFGAIKTEPVRS